jgi:hypothetical protein
VADRVLNDAGLLSHYVVDAAQPHHTTIHFNGWARGAPNPRGFTTSRDFHSQFESAFVRAHVIYQDLASRMGDAPEELGEVRETVWAYIQASNARVERLYELEKLHGFEGAAPAHPDAHRFAVDRLVVGAEMVRALWWKAWLESESLADELRGRRG